MTEPPATELVEAETPPRSHRSPDDVVSRRKYVQLFVVAFLIVLFVGYQEFQIQTRPTKHDISVANAQASAANAKANAGVGAAKSANASLSAAGLPTVAVPTSAAAPTATVTVSGATGPGPTDDQLKRVVAAYLVENPPTVEQPTIDYSKLQAFVVAYLADNPAPAVTGPKGDKGDAASDSQVAAGVAAYFVINPPQAGPKGDTGASGAPGSPAPSVTAISCGGNIVNTGASFTFQFSDGTSQTVTCE